MLVIAFPHLRGSKGKQYSMQKQYPCPQSPKGTNSPAFIDDSTPNTDKAKGAKAAH